MAGTYIVQKGDCLYSIAKEHGFSTWRTIYDHPNNAAFRQLRPDPDIIFAGDKLYIPDLEQRDENGNTEKRHTFKKPGHTIWIHIIVEDDEGKKLEGDYTIDIEGETFSGSLQNGEIERKIAADARVGTLVIKPKDAAPGQVLTWSLALGALDPIDTVAGIQERLWNLGFDSGPIDNIMGPLTKAGITAFQKMAFTDSKEWDGIAGPKTKAKLLEHHKV